MTDFEVTRRFAPNSKFKIKKSDFEFKTGQAG